MNGFANERYAAKERAEIESNATDKSFDDLKKSIGTST
tara:strand:- start:962 stop:1075 length:114 start_codon:yes stop_codon:yes gene_type:complete